MTSSEVATRNGIDNSPGPDACEELTYLCGEFLERLRDRFGPIHVTSGFRCRAVNGLIGGAIDSAHLHGRAADILPVTHTGPLWEALRDMVEWIKAEGLAVDQAIFEFGRWLHIGTAQKVGVPRRQFLSCRRPKHGERIYSPWDPQRIDPLTGLPLS